MCVFVFLAVWLLLMYTCRYYAPRDWGSALARVKRRGPPWTHRRDEGAHINWICAAREGRVRDPQHICCVEDECRGRSQFGGAKGGVQF